jgi:hypothetical protein
MLVVLTSVLSSSIVCGLVSRKKSFGRSSPLPECPVIPGVKDPVILGALKCVIGKLISGEAICGWSSCVNGFDVWFV